MYYLHIFYIECFEKDIKEVLIILSFKKIRVKRLIALSVCATVVFFMSGFIQADGFLSLNKSAKIAKVPKLSSDKVKCVLVFRFLNFVTWPSGSFSKSDDRMIVGVVDKEIYNIMKLVVKGKKIRNRQIEIIYLSATQLKSKELLMTCHSIYFGVLDLDLVKTAVGNLENSSTLLIGDREKFLQSGGMVNFLPGPSRVRYEVNNKRAKKCKLKIDKKILHFARHVIH